MKTKFNYLFILPLLALGCAKQALQGNQTAQNLTLPANSNMSKAFSVAGIPSFFAMGADASWIPQMEAVGLTFKNRSGVTEDALQVLKDQGVNSIRLRAWVNPSQGWCNTAHVVAMAVRAKAKGLHIMLDLHYSDTWADNKNQKKPAAWASHTFSQLLTDVYNYTYHVMDTLRTNGVNPDWVQVGNEINLGMLLPDGARSNPANLAQIINQGYAAVKAVSTSSQVIVHIAGESTSSQEGFFDSLTSNGANFDILGFSYYPYYNSQTYAQNNAGEQSMLNTMASRYGKKVMIVETGALWTDSLNTFNGLNDCFNRVSTVSNVSGLGVFYWEPEGYQSWSKYKLNAFDSITHAPTHAMDAFLYNPANNLINNSDFENSGVQSGTVTGWTVFTDNNNDAVNVITGGYTRTYRLSHYKATAYHASTYQQLTGVPNGTYMLTAWVQNSGGQTSCLMYAKGSGAEIDYSLPVTSNWQQVTIKNIAVTSGAVSVGFRSVANAGNWCHIDNVHLQLQ